MTDFPVPVFAFPGQTGGDDDFAVLYRADRVFRDEIDACAAALGTDAGPGRVLAAIIEGDVVSADGHPDGPAAGMAAVLAS